VGGRRGAPTARADRRRTRRARPFGRDAARARARAGAAHVLIDPGRMPFHQTPLGVACVVLGALALMVGALLSDAARLLRPDAFADRLGASLADDRVAVVAAEHLTDAVLAQQRDLTAFRPLILAAAEDVVGSGAFRGVARTAARRAHIAVGAGLWATRPVGEAVVARLADSPRTGDALAGLWPIAVAGVPQWGLMFGGIGVVLAAAGSSLLERLDVRDVGRRLARLVAGAAPHPFSGDDGGAATRAGRP
jgi:hypothetical protein